MFVLKIFYESSIKNILNEDNEAFVGFSEILGYLSCSNFFHKNEDRIEIGQSHYHYNQMLKSVSQLESVCHFNWENVNVIASKSQQNAKKQGCSKFAIIWSQIFQFASNTFWMSLRIPNSDGSSHRFYILDTPQFFGAVIACIWKMCKCSVSQLRSLEENLRLTNQRFCTYLQFRFSRKWMLHIMWNKISSINRNQNLIFITSI